jgi:hypothetical protein
VVSSNFGILVRLWRSIESTPHGFVAASDCLGFAVLVCGMILGSGHGRDCFSN